MAPVPFWLVKMLAHVPLWFVNMFLGWPNCYHFCPYGWTKKPLSALVDAQSALVIGPIAP